MEIYHLFSPGEPTASPTPAEQPDPRRQDQGDLDDFIYDRDGKISDL